jgi:hypothetical protein
MLAAKFVGKLVAGVRDGIELAAPPNQLPPQNAETPCCASRQYVYSCTPSRGIAAALLVPSWAAFSVRVMRDTRSAARSGNDGLVSR